MPRLLLSALLALALVVAPACGREDEKERSPEAAVAEAATRTTKAGTARMVFEASMEMSGVAEPINFAGEGGVDYRIQRSRLTMDMAELAELAQGELGDPGGWKGEIVYDRGVVYMRLPVFNELLPKAKPWIKMSADALIEQGATQFTSPDPDEFLRFVEAAGNTVKAVGEEEVRGVETTHYSGRIRVDKLPEVMPPGDRAALQAYARKLRAAGVEEFPLDVWLDEDGMVRRLRAEYRMKAEGRRANVAFSMDLFDFGARVAVRRPPPNQVSDFEELMTTARR